MIQINSLWIKHKIRKKEKAWCTPLIPAIRKQRKDLCQFMVCLVYMYPRPAIQSEYSQAQHNKTMEAKNLKIRKWDTEFYLKQKLLTLDCSVLFSLKISKQAKRGWRLHLNWDEGQCLLLINSEVTTKETVQQDFETVYLSLQTLVLKWNLQNEHGWAAIHTL